MEIFGYSREMTGHVMQMAGQMQAQAQAQQDQNQNQMNQLLAQAEAQRAEAQAQRADAKQREEAQRAEAKQRQESIRSENLAREELLIKMKTDADRTNAERERMIAENEFKRQKLFVDTNAAIQREKMQADLQKDIEFQQFCSRRKEIGQ